MRETTLLIAAPYRPWCSTDQALGRLCDFARKMGRAICIILPDGTLILERDESQTFLR